MTKWEYCQVQVGQFKNTSSAVVAIIGEHKRSISEGNTSIDVLNELGQDGWELVAITTLEVSHPSSRESWYKPIFILKRAVQD